MHINVVLIVFKNYNNIVIIEHNGIMVIRRSQLSMFRKVILDSVTLLDYPPNPLKLQNQCLVTTVDNHYTIFGPYKSPSSHLKEIPLFRAGVPSISYTGEQVKPGMGALENLYHYHLSLSRGNGVIHANT